jgi:hypothetical protein
VLGELTYAYVVGRVDISYAVTLLVLTADLLRPGKSDPSDEHDKGSSADLVHQVPPDDVIEAPSREAPMGGE